MVNMNMYVVLKNRHSSIPLQAQRLLFRIQLYHKYKIEKFIIAIILL